MSENWKPKEHGEVLPTGISIVSNAPAPQSKPEEYDIGTIEDLTKIKDKVWYVVLVRLVYPPENPYSIGRKEQTWLWAHTKSWARKLAIDARKEGYTVVDIFPGTKAHINHKYKGLK